MAEGGMRARGRLKIYLGYAAGVGKTYQMLEESQRMMAAGRDVVVGYFEPHGRADTIAKTEGLELVPRRVLEHRGCTFEEMDVDAILKRAPAVCAVDEFPHTNVPGSERGKRWEDVMVLLEAGIDVLATMNIQHLESLNDQVREITGVQVRETLPDWVVKQAEEVVLVDLPPPALMNRLRRGVVYSPEKAKLALDNFFKEPSLAALRELALRQIAHEVDARQSEPGRTGEPVERILIHITEAPATAGVIRRGRRVADYLKAECIAVCVMRGPNFAGLVEKEREAMERHLDFARKLHIEARILEGEDTAGALVDFARRNGVTQIVLSKPPRPRWPWRSKGQVAMRIVSLASDMQVMLVAERRGAAGSQVKGGTRV